MLRPRKMKFIELTVFKNDINSVLEYLGRKAVIQFPESEAVIDSPEITRVREILDRLIFAAQYTGIINTNTANKMPEEQNQNQSMDYSKAEVLTRNLCLMIENYKEREDKAIKEKKHISQTINEARAFSKLNVPFSDFEHLSYLTLRVGRLEPKYLNELREDLSERAVIIPLDESRILAASSKKGRFALDSQLKKYHFQPLEIPQNYKGFPVSMMDSLNSKMISFDTELEKKLKEKE